MRRSLGIVLAGLVALSACSDDGDDGASPPTTEPSEESTTTTAVASTTTEALPFDVEVRRAAIELLELRNDVFMNPNVSRVSDYIAATCVCLERERGFIERFVSEGLRWTEPPATPRAVRLLQADLTEPTLTVVAVQPAAHVVRDDGSVLEEVPFSDRSVYRVVLLRDATGDWKINGLEGLDLNDQAIDEVLAEGLP